MNTSSAEKNIIEAGDLVLVYLDAKRQFLVQVTRGLKLSSDHGSMDGDSIIGKPFGYTGATHLGRPFYCLKPSISDVMLKVKRMTTIVYPKDLGYLLLETSVGPGARVIEVGTGSGALTIALAKLVAPDGVVYSFERRDEFIQNAQKNVERAGCSQNVQFRVCDVAEDGFSDKNADAVFIDVPEPWTIVPHAAEAVKTGHYVVSWSPNVEQVKRTIDMLNEHHFVRISAHEMILRELLVRTQGTRPRERSITHTAYLVKAQKIIPAEEQK
jgi:tRNA (adenine57-N1/adenine58-N1)-methyltransferase